MGKQRAFPEAPADDGTFADPPKPKKVRSADEQELLAMRRMAKMLGDLSEPARGRVVQWITAKYIYDNLKVVDYTRRSISESGPAVKTGPAVS